MTSPRVQRHRKADANRRRVTTRGKRVPRPRAPKPPARRPKYRKSAALGGLSGMFGALFLATGQIFWAVGVVASSSGAAAAAYVDYRRDLIEVKRTGRPVGAPDPAKPPTAHPSLARRPPDTRKPAAKTPPKHGPEGHVCKAKTPSRCPYNRAAKTKTATTRKRTK